VLFLAHRRELIHQPRSKLTGVDTGLILAGEPMNQMARVQIASVQTFDSRCMGGDKDLPPADIVFIDEAHHARARTYRQIVDAYPEARVIGLTATPCRRDGRGLGNIFDAMVECPQVQELIDLGYLVKTLVYAPVKPDLKGVKVRQGDYVERELAERMDRAELVGDIVSHWHKHADRRKTVVFATSVAHSVHLRDEFVKSGVRAEHIDGSTPKDEREEILQRLSSGDLKLVSNCMVLTEGWDQPDVGCLVLARPTRSMGLYRQMVGRGLRPTVGKDHCLVLDHAGAIFQHGFVEDPVVWTLDEDRKAETPAQAARALSPSSRLLECSKCKAIRTGGKPCDHCGFMPRRGGLYHDVIEGDLAHLERSGKQRVHIHSFQEKHEWHAMLAHIGVQRGYKPGWAAHKYKEKFGHWPVGRHVEPIPPNAEVMAWDRHLRIKYAKSKQAEKARMAAYA